MKSEIPTLHDVEVGLRALLLGKEEQLMDGPPADRQRLYRRLVRFRQRADFVPGASNLKGRRCEESAAAKTAH